MGITKAVLISVVAVLLAPLASGQDTLRTQTNVVLVPALVKDGAGNVVYGLQAKDFIIEDNGVSQTVRMDESAVAEPVSLVIALQTGRTGSAEFERIRTLSSMLDLILTQEGAEVAIGLFDSHVDLVRDVTSDAALIQQHLKILQTGD